jgi:hypothetical protein
MGALNKKKDKNLLYIGITAGVGVLIFVGTKIYQFIQSKKND